MFPEKHEAAECLQRTTIDKSPSYTSSYLVLTICLVEQGREDEAEEARPGNQSQSNDLKILAQWIEFFGRNLVDTIGQVDDRPLTFD